MQRLETRLRVLTLLFRADPETAIEADGEAGDQGQRGFLTLLFRSDPETATEADAEAGDQAQGGILTLLLGSPDNQ